MQPNPECQKLVAEVGAEATESLFDAYGVQVVRRKERAIPDDAVLMCGVIGFTGPTLRGTLILAANDLPLEASNPVPGSPLRDWISELTNQLVGRVKNRMRAYGVEIYITTPVVLRGVLLAPVPRSELRPMCFTAPNGGVLWVWTEVETPEGFLLGKIRDDDARDVTEGHALMF